MKRRLLIVAVFLLAGVVVNVVVAWALAASFTQVNRSHPPITEEFSEISARIPTDAAGEVWVPHVETGWNQRTTTRYSGIGVYQEFKWARRRTDRGEVNRDRRGDLVVWSFRAGFPMLSLRGDSANVLGVEWRRGVWFTERTGDIRTALYSVPVLPGLPLTPSGPRAFPYAIPFYAVWPGFAVNTILYATVLWLLWAGLLGLHRRIRVWRGLCPACAYPRGVSDVCSECGTAIPSRKVTAT